MASNFKMLRHYDGDSLHLKLMGDFDGTSAYQLTNILKKNQSGIGKVFVHTAGLKHIYSFGCGIFHYNICRSKKLVPGLIFTGENAEQIAPKGSRILPS